MLERSLVYVKPDALERYAEVYAHLDTSLKDYFSNTKLIHLIPAPEAELREQYKHVKGIVQRDYPQVDADVFFEDVIKFYSQGIILSIYSGDDIIQRIKTIVGPTDPHQAPKDTIRGRFSDDSLSIATTKYRRPVKNVIHASGKDAENDIRIWAKRLRQEGLNIADRL